MWNDIHNRCVFILIDFLNIDAIIQGKGNDIVLEAIKHVGNYLVGRRIDDLFEDMGAMWSSLVSNSQLRVCDNFNEPFEFF